MKEMRDLVFYGCTLLLLPFYRGVLLWNRLDRDVQRATTKVKFKTMLKKLGR